MRYFSTPWQMEASRIALGGNIFGHFTDQQQTAAVINAAENEGINFIDTADVYSKGISETFIGGILSGRRHRWILASKAGLESHANPSGLGAEKIIRDKLEGSLRRLRTDYIDLYQMHHFDPATPLETTLQCLDALCREGKIRAYGVSNYSDTELQETYKTASRFALSPPFSIQSHYNLFVRSAEKGVFSVSKDKGTCVLLYGVLARGILSTKYKDPKNIPRDSRATTSESLRRDLTSEVLTFVQEMMDVAESVGLTLAQAALSWSLRLPQASAAIMGMRTPEQVVSLARGVDVKLSDEIVHKLEILGGKAWQANSSGFGTFSRSSIGPSDDKIDSAKGM
jgi:aryl-alcohol dehydrogenase-like predicted oxidoreductase